MKRITMFFFAYLFAVGLSAQGLTVSVKKMEAAKVPESVKSAQASFFPNQMVKYWEEHTAKGPKNRTYTKYVAKFQTDKSPTRAQYTSEGKGISASTYYTSNTMPTSIQEAAAENYPNLNLIRGNRIESLVNHIEVFRIVLRKGAQKLTVYVDAAGDEISKENLPKEIVEEGEDKTTD